MKALVDLAEDGYDVRLYQPFSGTVAVVVSRLVEGRIYSSTRAFAVSASAAQWEMEIAYARRELDEALA